MIARSTLALLALTALVRCGGDDDAKGSALRFANTFGQRVGAVDLYLDDERVAEGLAYGSVSSFVDASAGRHTLVARRAGVRDGEPVTSCDVELQGRRLVYPVGQLADDVLSYSCTLASDSFEAGPGAKLIADAALGFDRYSAELVGGFFSGGIGFDLDRDGVDGVVYFENVQLSLTADVAHEVAINAGPGQIAAFSLPAFADGVSGHAVLIGEIAPLDPAAGGMKLLVVPTDGEAVLLQAQPIVYVYNARYDGLLVDVDYGGNRIVEDLGYRRFAGPIMHAAGALAYAFLPGVSLPVADFATLEAGSVQLVIIAANNTATLIKPDRAPFGAGIRVRAVHAASAGPLAFRYEYAGNLSAPIDTLSFGESSPAEGTASTSSGTIALYNGALRIDDNNNFGELSFALGYARGIAIAVGVLEPQGAQPQLQLDTITILNDWAWF